MSKNVNVISTAATTGGEVIAEINSKSGMEQIPSEKRASLKSQKSRINFLRRPFLIVAFLCVGMGNVFAQQISTSQDDHCFRSLCGLQVACNDYPKMLTYSEAVNTCPAGYRLPTIEELECMTQNKPILKLPIGGEYWSGTQAEENGKAYTITMDDQKREECNMSEKKRVRYIKASNYTEYHTELQNWQSADRKTNGYALLHLYRPGMFWGSAVGYGVDLEDQEDVWRCKNGRKNTIKITKEGPITIHAKTESDVSLTFDVEFGKEYFVGCYIRPGFWIGVPVFTLQETEDGRSDFNKIKAKNDDTEK